MAIDQFAQSLLSDVRQRNRDLQKEREREERKALLAGIGVNLLGKIGNKVLAQQTENFINSTEYRGAAQVARVADNNIADFEAEWNRIENSKQDPMEYLMNKYKPIVEERMKANTPDWQEGLTNYDGILFKRTRELAEQQLDRLMQARNIYEDKGMDQNATRLEMIAKKYRPATIEDFVTGRLVNFFGGKSREDYDREEILALKDFTDSQEEGSRGYYAKKLRLLKEEYDRSGDLAVSKAYAEGMTRKEADPAEKFFTEVKTDIKTVGDKSFIYEITNTYDLSSPGGIEKPIRSTTKFKGDPTSLLSNAEIVKASIDAFNPMDWVDDNFTEEAKSLFYRELANNKVSAANIKTPEEFATLVSVFDTMAADSMSYRNKRADEFYSGTVKVIMEQVGFGNMLSVLNMPESTQEEIDAKEKAKQNLFLKLGGLNAMSAEAADYLSLSDSVDSIDRKSVV